MNVSVFDLLRTSDFHEDGSFLTFPKMMSKGDYARAKNALAKLGCRWNSQKKTHIFDDAMTNEIWQNILKKEVLPKLNPLSYFPTPPEGIDHIRLFAQDWIYPHTTMRILEPSAGSGAIIDMIIDLLRDNESGELNPSGSVIDAIEVQPHMADILRVKYGHLDWVNVICQEFEDYDPVDHYDVVVMNPPFSNSLYAKHILRASTMTKKKGDMIFVAPRMFKSLSNRGHIKKLQQMMSDGCGYFEEMETTRFSGTSVSTLVGTVSPHIVVDERCRLWGLACSIQSSMNIPKNTNKRTFRALTNSTVKEAREYGRFYLLSDSDWDYLYDVCVWVEEQ